MSALQDVVAGSGCLAVVADLCDRKDWIKVRMPAVFYEGQQVKVMSCDGEVLRGETTVMAVSQRHARIYVEKIPVATQRGDLLVVTSQE